MPGIPLCTAGTASPTIRPTLVYLSCADGGISVTNITWGSWGAEAAIGNGTLNVNDCQPDCAAGTFKSYPASIEVFDPNLSNGMSVFQVVRVIPANDAGQVELSSDPGGWGAP